jgi:hypothetical protein
MSQHEWVNTASVPEEITGERRELIELVMRYCISNEAEYRGPSPRTWRFTFADTGGWRTVREIRQDCITPTSVLNLLHGEAFGDREVMAFLQQLNHSR